MKLISFVGGIAVGYVLGAKAGAGRYDQIVATVRGLGERTGMLPPEDAPSATVHPETLGDLAASAAATAAAPD